MFQSLMVTGLTPLCNTNEIENWYNRPFNGEWPEIQRCSVRAGTEVTKTIKKKKRVRTAYSTNQLRSLEKIYSVTKYIDAKRRKELAATLNIGDKALKIWFQNRRMKEKKESSESSCDTSSEVTSCQSPLLVQENGDQKGEIKSKFPNSNYSETCEQYQFPTFYYNESVPAVECQNGYPYFQNGGDFSVDTSAYSTQYYPSVNEGQYNNINMDAYSHAQNICQLDTWYAKSFDLSYF